MFEHQGVWLPDGEAHFPSWMDKNGEIVDGRGTYQIKKLRAALEHVKQFRNAVDVGGHVGLWSMQLAKKFRVVHAFEPMEPFRQCFVRNVEAKNVLLYPIALGAASGRVSMAYDPKDSGGTHVRAAGVEDGIVLRALDEFIFSEVDFLKVDVEGWEHQVIEGARDTIMRCRPVVIVEQKQHKLKPNFGITGTPAVDLLRDMGYRLVREISGDFIMVADA